MARRRVTTVQELVDAAARVFQRVGYVDATIADIAAEAGVSKPTVYQYVDSKRWLLETIVEQVIYPLRHNIDQILTNDDPPRDKLVAFIRVHVESAITYRTYYAVLTADQHQLSPQALRNYRSWARDVNHATEKLLHKCVESGVIRDDLDIGISAHLLNGMLLSIARWFHTTGRVPAEQLVDQVLGMLSGYILD
ncbi:TetR/AcrR family transcriptional regulator [Mycolicibacterium chitae]|uniref:TetR family transcriptional regulator n=1 Tax=Mycolicibacterium chitae TaxID=1792 RepID=A0A3S4VIL3_MYCCI|nr:TetR/AcrR family transcriptional regulator [Mycolicibacterium chitae]MCV7109186.1 TetR/AcrR family transcriptional regulator [Mycolicibacterium chitae]VEG48430.1 TetR family transcriptional regulator [Mycolicibacterium chitae]